MKITPTVSIQGKCGCGNVYSNISHEDGVVKYIKMSVKHKGTCPRVLCDVNTNLANLAIEYKAPISKIIKALDNHECEKRVPNKRGGTTKSCADCLAQALKEFEDEHVPHKIKKK